MGISKTDLTFLSELAEFRNVRSVCDLGDQDLLPNGRASDYWKSLGMRHLSLDVVGEATRFDLNTDSVPSDWEQFDLVTNCGDTEHVINQLNCFRVIHDLTKVGGLMYHSLPVAGYSTHGFFNYNLKFFSALARANQYKILESHVDVNIYPSPLYRPEDSGPMVKWLDKLQTPDAGLRVAMRKTNGHPFTLPLDVPIEALRGLQPLAHPLRMLKRYAGLWLRRAGLVS